MSQSKERTAALELIWAAMRDGRGVTQHADFTIETI